MSAKKALKFDKSAFVSYKNTPITKEYTLGKTLGAGAFGTVRSAVHKATKQNRAIKILKKSEQDEEKLFLEVNILSKLSHPNIMHIYEFYDDNSNFYIVSELCPGGELFDMITEKGCFSEQEACPIMKQLMSAITYCHQNHIVHRDLKPENILLEDHKGTNEITIKLIDWGGARYFSKNKKMTKINGTPYYIAPEVLNEIYDEKCDIWSAGVIFYILLCGYPPFNGETDKEIMKAVKKGEFDFPPEEWEVVSNEAKDLIKKMLTYEPKKRPTALEVLQHVWFKSFNKNSKENKQLAKSSLENMKRFKRDKQFEQATISFIVNQVITKEEQSELRKQFMEWDKNGDGVLSKEEILEGYRNAYGTVDPDEVDNMIKSVDLDGNGVIDWNEFLNCTMNRDKILSKKNLEYAFKVFDKDGSGAISVDEIMLIFKKTSADVDKQVFEKMIKDADENNDGEIEFEEFKNIMEKFFK